MMALAGGIALETQRLRVRLTCLALVALMAVPLAYTLSRASFLAVPFVLAALGVFSSRRLVVVGALLLLLVAAPLIGVALLPKAVVNRILYTFEPEAGQATIRFGKLALDPSTSARFISAQQAFVAWTRQPVLGYGVTGARFMDVQYARTLVETGIVGLAVFLWLAWSALKSSLASFRMLRDPEERGLALGFLAGTIGLLVHAVGANTFIIVRIMEPFWFFAAVDRKSTRLNSSHGYISYAVFCLKKKKIKYYSSSRSGRNRRASRAGRSQPVGVLASRTLAIRNRSTWPPLSRRRGSSARC